MAAEDIAVEGEARDFELHAAMGQDDGVGGEGGPPGVYGAEEFGGGGEPGLASERGVDAEGGGDAHAAGNSQARGRIQQNLAAAAERFEDRGIAGGGSEDTGILGAVHAGDR